LIRYDSQKGLAGEAKRVWRPRIALYTVLGVAGVIALSVALSTLLVLLSISGTSAFVAFYNLIVNLSTDAAMLPYVFCSVVEAVLFVKRRPISRALRIGPFMPVAIVAFVFSLSTIYGAGAEAGMWSLILIMTAAPIWIFLHAPQSGESED